MARSTESFTRCYDDMWSSDPDFLEFCNDSKRRAIFIKLMISDQTNSGIHVLNLDQLATATLIKKEFIKIFLTTPNPLFEYDSIKSVIWLKWKLFYNIKLPGSPQAFLRGIINDYNTTKQCKNLWEGFFRWESNIDLLNKFYKKHFKAIANLVNEQKPATEYQLLAFATIEELYEIKIKVLKETARPHITFSTEGLMAS